jgi:hypothetical protein
MAIKKKCIAARLGVIYNSHATNRKQEGPPVRELPSLPALLLVGWESYDSGPTGMHKNTVTNRWKLLLFDRKIA